MDLLLVNAENTKITSKIQILISRVNSVDAFDSMWTKMCNLGPITALTYRDEKPIPPHPSTPALVPTMQVALTQDEVAHTAYHPITSECTNVGKLDQEVQKTPKEQAF
jgi:hypothetical protein